jgi:hypothetical protein
VKLYDVVKMIKDRMLDIVVMIDTRIMDREADHIKRTVAAHLDDYCYKVYVLTAEDCSNKTALVGGQVLLIGNRLKQVKVVVGNRKVMITSLAEIKAVGVDRCGKGRVR